MFSLFFTFIRSTIYNLWLVVWTVFIASLGLPLFIHRNGALHVARLWSRGIIVAGKLICGLHYKIEGEIPSGPVILASKHQSAWETVAYLSLFSPCPGYILKRELFLLPFIGWYMMRMRQVGINRRAGRSAIKQVIRDGKKLLDEEGRPLIIFPEGTRVSPFAKTSKYQSGIVGIVQATGAPVIPIAVNTGLFWGKGSYMKYPGTITIRLLPEISTDLSKDAFMEALKIAIETHTQALVQEVIDEQQFTSSDSVDRHRKYRSI